jgi:hypothetical protein
VGDGERAAAGEVHEASGRLQGAAVEVDTDQSCDVLSGWLGGHLRGGALLDDAAVLDDQETVGHDHGLERIVGDDQDRPGELVEVAAELRAHVQTCPGIQRGQWFVQEQEGGLGRQCSGRATFWA